MSAAFTREEALQATGGTARGALPERFACVCTDSRKIEKGSLFVALKGESFDGHQFVAGALAAGAAAAVVERGFAAQSGQAVVEVDDTLAALGRLARHHRRRFAIPVGAITGSNGKTTTKEMIGAILATRGPALKTEGNLNNEVGVPLTLFGLTSAHTAAIVEMGMNHPGELSRLSRWAEPHCAAITSVAAAHLAGLGTIEAVARAKGEIFEGLAADGLAIANADDPLVLAQAKASGRRTLTFGRSAGADVRLAELASHDARGLGIRIAWAGRTHAVQLRFVGEHNAVNACAAFAMGVSLGCSAEQCVAGLEAARPYAHRLSLVEAPGGFTVLDDCYNANPASMAAALRTLAALSGSGRRVAVLGDMLELGEGEEALHRAVGEQALQAGLALFVAFGPRSKAAADAARALGEDVLHVPRVEDAAAAVSFLQPRLRAGDLLLVKGSRGMRLERVIDSLLGRQSAGGGH